MSTRVNATPSHVPEEPHGSERMLYVAEDILISTWRALREYAQRGCEGTVRWAGPAYQARNAMQVATTVLVPGQRVGPGRFELPHEATRAMGEALGRDGLINLAQLHTHPGSGVRHSPWDDERAYSSRDGALSIVWPHHGQLLAPVRLWGVHECRGRAWVRLTGDDATQRIVVLPSLRDLRVAVELLRDARTEADTESTSGICDRTEPADPAGPRHTGGKWSRYA
jgi:hypothetical protein